MRAGDFGRATDLLVLGECLRLLAGKLENSLKLHEEEERVRGNTFSRRGRPVRTGMANVFLCSSLINVCFPLLFFPIAAGLDSSF